MRELQELKLWQIAYVQVLHGKFRNLKDEGDRIMEDSKCVDYC